MNALFRERAFPGVVVDADETPEKHDSVALRESRCDWRAGKRRRFITARRLESWLVSDWHHKRRHMGLPDLDFEPVRSGLYYSMRLGGTWVAADWWLQYFEVDTSVTALRLEQLSDDLNRHLLPLLPADTEPFASTPRWNTRPDAKPTTPAFSRADAIRIRSANPRWVAWEEGIYSVT